MRKVSPWALVGVMAVVVAVLAAVLVIRASGPSARDRLRAVGSAVDAAGTAQLDLTVEVGDTELGIGVTGAGAVDFASGAGWITLEMAGQRLEMRTDGELLFVLAPGHLQWMATHADELDAGSFGAGPAAVVALVDGVRGGAAEVDDLGAEEVDGVATRHLRVVVDPERVGDALAALAPPGGALTVDVWMDEDDLPVRQRVDGQVQGVDLVLTVDLDGWGEPLGVEIPPAGEIRDVEAEELAELFGPEGG